MKDREEGLVITLNHTTQEHADLQLTLATMTPDARVRFGVS